MAGRGRNARFRCLAWSGCKIAKIRGGKGLKRARNGAGWAKMGRKWSKKHENRLKTGVNRESSPASGEENRSSGRSAGRRGGKQDETAKCSKMGMKRGQKHVYGRLGRFLGTGGPVNPDSAANGRKWGSSGELKQENRKGGMKTGRIRPSSCFPGSFLALSAERTSGVSEPKKNGPVLARPVRAGGAGISRGGRKP